MTSESVATSRRLEWGLRGAVVLALAFVFQPLLLQPSGLLYSDASDIFPQHYPNRLLMSASLRENSRLPLWDPIEFCGTAFTGDPQSGIFYPPNWLHALLPPDESGALFGWMVLLHLIAGGWGMLWWLRGRGLSPAARLVGALAFCLGAKWFQHVVVPGHVVYLPLAWAPWQLGLVDRLWRAPSLRAAAALGLVTALVVTGCHPQILFYTYLVVAGYALCAAWAPRAPKPLASSGALIVAGVVALLSMAAHLLPVLDLLERDLFVRATGISYEQAARYSLSLAHYRSFLFPSMVGTGWELTCYVGAAATSLALFGVLRKRDRVLAVYFLGTIGFALWFGLGKNGSLHPFLHEHVPGFGLFRIPTRIFLILGIPVGYLAASAADALRGEARSPSRRIFAGMLAIVGFLLLSAVRSVDATWTAFGMSLPALCLVRAPGRVGSAVTGAVVLLVAADGIRYARPLVEVRSPEETYGRNPVVDIVRAPLGRHRTLALNHTRKGRFSSLPITYAAMAEVEILHGFNPLLPRGCYRFLWSGVADERLKWRYTSDMGTFPIVRRRFLDLLNVRWVVTNEPLDLEGLALREKYDDLEVYHYTRRTKGLTRLDETFVYENEHVLPRAGLVRRAEPVASVEEAIEKIPSVDPRRIVLLEGAGELTSYGGVFAPVDVAHRRDELRMTVEAGEGGYLVLSEMWFPGWRAWDGDRELEILRANGVFQAVRLSPGPHELRFEYRPSAHTWGVRTSSVGVGLGALLLVFGGGRRPARDPSGA